MLGNPRPIPSCGVSRIVSLPYRVSCVCGVLAWRDLALRIPTHMRPTSKGLGADPARDITATPDCHEIGPSVPPASRDGVSVQALTRPPGCAMAIRPHGRPAEHSSASPRRRSPAHYHGHPAEYHGRPAEGSWPSGRGAMAIRPRHGLRPCMAAHSHWTLYMNRCRTATDVRRHPMPDSNRCRTARRVRDAERAWQRTRLGPHPPQHGHRERRWQRGHAQAVLRQVWSAGAHSADCQQVPSTQVTAEAA